jgi:hypothetical protein
MIAGAIAVSVLVIAGAVVGANLKPWVRAHILHALNEKFGERVVVENLEISLFPPHVTAGPFKVDYKEPRAQALPLIYVERLDVVPSPMGLFKDPIHVKELTLQGLKIQIQHKLHDDDDDDDKPKPKKKHRPIQPFIIDDVNADGTLLRIFPKKKTKPPLDYELHKLHLTGAGPEAAMAFDATLTNAKPPGNIETRGNFGPWENDDEGQTPVSGKYLFQHADLGVFKGISGILSSDGEYEGVLERLDVRGNTDTPDFAISVAKHPVHLKTKFTAVVDGTSGDTYLEPVEAQFLNSTLIARGSVTGQEGVHGKTISLQVTMEKARMEDLLHLVMKGNKPPILTGAVQLTTKFDIPPGEDDVIDKIRLNGNLKIANARFSDDTIQDKVDTLSKKGSGRPKDQEIDNVASNLTGHFTLKDTVANLSELTFSVPGAMVELHGTYDLDDESLDFEGHLRLDAKVSQTMTGFKSFLLKVVDPLFKRDGAGAVIPIRISGTRSEPSFKMDVKKALKRK